MSAKGALFSIRPCYVNKILSGEKRFEFRKAKIKSDVSTLYIYETAPVSAVVGECHISAIHEGLPASIWNFTKSRAGIDRLSFDAYFSGHSNAVAYELDDITVYDKPKKLSEFGLRRAPQSYAYVTLP